MAKRIPPQGTWGQDQNLGRDKLSRNRATIPTPDMGDPPVRIPTVGNQRWSEMRRQYLNKKYGAPSQPPVNRQWAQRYMSGQQDA